MEAKKSSDANVDKLRLPFIAIGFLFVGSLVLASFSYTAGVLKDDQGDRKKKMAAIELEPETKKEEEKPVETPPEIEAPAPITEDIKPKENTDKKPPATVDPGPPPPAPVGNDDVKKIEKPKPVDFPDVEATFPGGTVEMMKWIQANIEYPQMAIENGDQGKVYLSFVVEADGKITDIKIERKVTPELDKEAKRMMREMPSWTPGILEGQNVPTRCRLPIAFTLN